MSLFRKKILILLITGTAIIAVTNISIQLATIIQLFPSMNISNVLAEELIETAQDCSEESLDAYFGFDLFLTKDVYTLQNKSITNAVISFFNGIQLPTHPCLDKVIPPPKG